jgi:hypothetical protein
MVIPKRRALVAFAVGLSLSLAAQLQFAEGRYPPQASFQTFGLLYPSSSIEDDTCMGPVLYAIWKACSFIGISLPLASLFSQSSFTTRSWGAISLRSYTCVWVHMVPFIVLSRLIIGDHHHGVGLLAGQALEDVTGGTVVWTMGTAAAVAEGHDRGTGWDEVVVVGRGSVVSSWCVGLMWSRLWSNHRQYPVTIPTHKPSSVDKRSFHFVQSRV